MIDNYFICYRIKKLWSNAFMVINDLFSIFSILGMTSHVKTNCLSKGLVYNRKMERSSLGFLRNFHYKSSLNSILDFQFRFILEWKDYFGKKERNTSLNYHTVLYLCYMRPVLFFSFFFFSAGRLRNKALNLFPVNAFKFQGKFSWDTNENEIQIWEKKRIGCLYVGVGRSGGEEVAVGVEVERFDGGAVASQCLDDSRRF